MKRILILTAILVFGCSSDDSSDTNDSSNQTFLERYDGVVWENPYFVSDPQSEEDLYSAQYIILNNSSNFLTYYRPNMSMVNLNTCYGISEGLNSNGETYTITNNDYNSLQFTSDNGEENTLSIVDVTVSNNRIYFDVSYSTSTNTYQEFANRTTLTDPCE